MSNALAIRTIQNFVEQRQISRDVDLLILNELRGWQNRWNNVFADRRRNVEKECGYIETSELTPERFRDVYDRHPIAARVVNIYPDESWQVQPLIKENPGSSGNDGEFEKAWTALPDSLNEGSRWRDPKNNPVWNYLHRADRLSGIGRYGIILIGVDDGLDLEEPVMPSKDLKIIYLRVLDEANAPITQWETDTSSTRYGKPLVYTINLGTNPITGRSSTSPLSTVNVHHSRIVHLADNRQGDEIFGISRLQQPFNCLYDLWKLYGGSAEMYWQGAFPGIAFQTQTGLGGQVQIDVDGMKNQLEQYMTGLQRYLHLNGLEAKQLSPQVVDPSPQIERQLEAIAIMMDVPKRIFIGSEEVGDAEGNDQNRWHIKIKRRQIGYLTPSVIVPFIDRLVELQILPTPEQYSVAWPEITVVTEDDRSKLAVRKTEALARYVQGDVNMVMSPVDYLVKILGMDPAEAKDIVKDRVDALLEDAELISEVTEITTPPEPVATGGSPSKAKEGAKGGTSYSARAQSRSKQDAIGSKKVIGATK